MAVPSTVAKIAERNAISMLTRTAGPSPGYANGWSQLSIVNPCQVKLKRPAGLLNENRITTAIGSIR